MLDTNEPYLEVFGPERSKGIVYRQGDKMYNMRGYEIDHNGKLLEKMPEKKDPEIEQMEKEEADLMLAERIRIIDPHADGYIPDDQLREEVVKRGKSIHHATGRPKLIEAAKEVLKLS